jgi:hypothetical protein
MIKLLLLLVLIVGCGDGQTYDCTYEVYSYGTHIDTIVSRGIYHCRSHTSCCGEGSRGVYYKMTKKVESDRRGDAD